MDSIRNNMANRNDMMIQKQYSSTSSAFTPIPKRDFSLRKEEALSSFGTNNLSRDSGAESRVLKSKSS